MDGFDSKRLDDVLGMFSGVNGGRIPAGLLLNHEETPEDWSRAIEFLTEKGYLKQMAAFSARTDASVLCFIVPS